MESHISGTKLVPVDTDDGNDARDVADKLLVRLMEGIEIFQRDCRFAIATPVDRCHPLGSTIIERSKREKKSQSKHTSR